MVVAYSTRGRSGVALCQSHILCYRSDETATRSDECRVSSVKACAIIQHPCFECDRKWRSEIIFGGVAGGSVTGTELSKVRLVRKTYVAIILQNALWESG